MRQKNLLAIAILTLTVHSGKAQDSAPSEIPETVVVGRPGAFPRNALQNSSLVTPAAQAASPVSYTHLTLPTKA